MMFTYVLTYLFFLFWMLHPVHVSFVNMDIKTNEKRIDFSVRLFHDDLGMALYNKYHDDMFEPRDSVSSRDFTDEYIKSKFTITDKNGKELNYFLEDKEITDDCAIMMYSCELQEKEIDSIIIRNSILLDLYSDQKNLVIINKDGIEKGYTLNSDENIIELLNLN